MERWPASGRLSTSSTSSRPSGGGSSGRSPASGRDRRGRRRLVRASLHRAAIAAGQPVIVRGRSSIGRLAPVRQPRLPGRRRLGAPPRRSDRARLPADGRTQRRPTSGGHPRSARPRPPAASRSTCRPSLRSRPRSSSVSTERSRQAHFPDSFEARDRALRRLAFDELLALQLGMVGRRRQRGRSRAIAIPVADESRPGRPRGDQRRRSSGGSAGRSS